MSTGNLLLIAGIVFCLMFSAFFSACEMAFSSANKVRLKNLAGKGNKKAKAVLRVLEDYDRMLSTILIGNNIVNIASATIATIVFVSYFGGKGATIATVVTTILVLIFGEISPKSFAQDQPEKIAMALVTPLKFFIVALRPLTIVFAGWGKLLDLVIKPENRPTVTEDELITYVEEAQSGGEIDAHESELIRSAIEFTDLDVSEILTPRVDVIGVDKNEKFDLIRDTFSSTGYSRLPVYEDTIDHIIGIIHEKDFFALLSGGKTDLRSIMTPVLHVNQEQKISTLLRKLQGQKSHMAVVLDEFGGTKGIVTLEDILEELVGEIWDEHDEVVEYFKDIGNNQFLVVGNTDLSELFEKLNVPADSSDYEIVSVSGWVIHLLEGIPEVGDELDFKNLHIRVTRADHRKVLEVQATVNPDYQSEDEDGAQDNSEG